MYGRCGDRARLSKCVGNNHYLQLLTIIILCTLFSHVQGIVTLDPCTVGVISGTDVTILRNETDVFGDLTCVCDIQCNDLVVLSISYRFRKTERNDDENLRIKDGTSDRYPYERHSNNKTDSVAKYDSLSLTECNVTVVYQWRKQNKQNKTGYLRVNLTGSNSFNVMCKGTGYVMTTLNPELPSDVTTVTSMEIMPTESGRETSKTSSSTGLMSNTIIIIAVVVPTVVILTIIILVVIFFLRRKQTLNKGGYEDENDISPYAQADPDAEKPGRRRRQRKQKIKQENETNTNQEVLYAQPIKEGKKGGKVKADVMDTAQTKYQELTAPIPPKSDELIAATRYDDVTIMKSTNNDKKLIIEH